MRHLQTICGIAVGDSSITETVQEEVADAEAEDGSSAAFATGVMSSQGV